MNIHPAVKIASAVIAVGIFFSSILPRDGKAMGVGDSASLPQNKGTYVHIGDCGVDRYGLPESGAGGYCYLTPENDTVSDTAHGYKGMIVFYSSPVVVHDDVEITPLPACVSTSEYHPCP